MVTCTFCKKTSVGSKSTFHRFPWKDSTLLETWLEKMGFSNNWVPTKHSRLCSDHFTTECYDTGPSAPKRTLKKGSVPTVFVDSVRKCAYCKIPAERISPKEVRRVFHKFPVSTPKMLDKWLRNMGLQDWYPTAKSLLCSDHFEKSCYRLVRGYPTLRDGSIPTIFTPRDGIEEATCVPEIAVDEIPLSSSCTDREHFLEQPPDLNRTELETNPRTVDQVDEHFGVDEQKCDTSVTCPNCNHKFEARISCGHSKQKFPFIVEEDPSKRLHTECAVESCEISKSMVGIGPNVLDEESVAEPSTSECSTPYVSTELKSPDLDEKRKLVSHDHRYLSSPFTTERKMQSLYESNQKLRQSLRMERQRSNRMGEKITSLQEVVSELRRTYMLPDNSLDCLYSIAETDVSQFGYSSNVT